MDYGQPMQPSVPAQEPDFFTSGAGTNAEDVNTFEAENNLDLTNPQSSWGASPERNARNIGNTAISSRGTIPSATLEAPHFAEKPHLPEAPNPLESLDSSMSPDLLSPESSSRNSKIVERDQPNTPKLGQITPLSNENITPNQEVAAAYDEKALKTTDKLDLQAVKIVDDAIAKLNQDGNISDFYDTARNMMETNLKNSYNRKLAA